MNNSLPFLRRVDWLMVFLYLALCLMGWFNIYAAVYDEQHHSIFDFSQRYGAQLLWIVVSCIMGGVVMLLDSRLFSRFAYFFYAVAMLLLVATLLRGMVVHGSRSWLTVGGFRLQPAEFAKFATCLAVGKCMSRHGFTLAQWRYWVRVGLVLALPVGLILLQNDFGSAFVFSSFLVVLYREGMPAYIPLLLFFLILLFVAQLFFAPLYVLGALVLIVLLVVLYRKQWVLALRMGMVWIALILLLHLSNHFFNLSLSSYHIYLYPSLAIAGAMFFWGLFASKRLSVQLSFVFLLCIGVSLSVDYVMNHVLSTHHQRRIYDMLGVEDDPLGWGYNVNQSKIAIGSGGVWGKGYLQGTQTKYNFVPEQSTDFIFCTVGEEWGFMGSLLLIGIFTGFLLRLVQIAERQHNVFSRIYGYGVVGIFFFHIAVNISMTIGLFPVIGIPLPFFSYGGSSMLAFSLMLFTLLKMDAERI